MATVSISPPSAQLTIGDTVRLTATVRDGQGNALARTVTWSSGDPAVATVSTAGLVTAVAAGGPVSVSASVDGKSAAASVTVQPLAAIAQLELERATATMALRQALKMVATARGPDGQLLTGRPVAWTSSDPAIATVGADGSVTAQTAGTATITARAEGKSASTTVTVVAMRSITAGYSETCALSAAGKLYCAGARQGPRARLVAPSLRFKSVTTSARLHDAWCAIATDDTLHCWGENFSGELGVGDSASRSSPTAVAGALRFGSIAFGQGVRGGLLVNGVPIPAEPANHACALTLSNDLYCWGDGKSGQFGTGSQAASATPVAAAPGRKYREVTAGRMYTCAIAEDAKTYCWGDNEAGHLGQGSWSSVATLSPLAVSGGQTFHGLSGAGATCALLADGAAWCWGDNGVLKLGAVTAELCFGSKPCSTTPVAVSTTRRFTALASSQYSTCALEAAGNVYCWGMNVDDKFGSTVSPATCSTPNSLAPCTADPTAGPTGVVTLSSGATTVCGMRSDGGAYCWGGNGFGQLGAPGMSKSLVPVVFSLDPATPP